MAGCAGSGPGKNAAPPPADTSAGSPAVAADPTSPQAPASSAGSAARSSGPIGDFKAPPSPAGRAPGSFAIIDGKEAEIPKVKLGDPRIVAKIIDEGKGRNQVMRHLEHLSQKIGHRLTGSSNCLAANNWTRDLYAQWGLSNPRLEQWGTVGAAFDRGPSSGKVLIEEQRRQEDGSTKPEVTTAREMQVTTLAWARGTDGPVRGPVVKIPRTEEEYAAVKDRLKGAWILMEPPKARGMRDVRGRMSDRFDAWREARKKVSEGADKSTIELPARLALEGVAGFIMSSRDERVWTGSIKGWREMTAETVDPEVFVSVRLSDYDYLNSRLADGDTPLVEFDLRNEFRPGPAPVYNTIAEIPGTTWPEQCVIISAHIDSWDGPGSQGATDNGTGTAVTLEAARILATVLKDAPAAARPKRTIKFIHWSGEEQGLLGSDAWVKAHEADWDKISACFVDDGGTNSQGGLPCADVQVEMLAAATAPINNVFYSRVDGRYLNVNIHSTGPVQRMGGGSDHMSFGKVGIPGFFWDEIGRADYGYGWHTQHDRLDLAIPEYLEQSSTNSALVAYQLACADTLLPRAPKEERSPGQERPERGQGRPRAGAQGQGPAAAPAPRVPAPPAPAPAPAPAGTGGN